MAVKNYEMNLARQKLQEPSGEGSNFPQSRVSTTEKQFPAEPTPHILVVDDHPMICEMLERVFKENKYIISTAISGEQALEKLRAEDVDLVVTDICLPDLTGIELTRQIRDSYPDVAVILMTGYPDVDTAIEALRLGSCDYIRKPFSVAEIQAATKSVLNKVWGFIELRHLRRLLKDESSFAGMLSKSPEMHRVFETVRSVSPTDLAVVIEGETGTGKELVAKAVHHHSPRRNGPFIPINCAGFPESLLESELFGYERGAFTGAIESRAGKIELANGGSLFLDEIESMSLAMQAKLLRVLEEKKIQRLGSPKTTTVDMRFIAASNVPLDDLVAKGQIRQDFYFRISVVPIRLPPLRHRPEDIPLLAHYFLHHHPDAKRKKITRLSRRAMTTLMEYPWPGNVRELQNVLERAIVLTRGHTIARVPVSGITSSIQDKAGEVISPISTLDGWLKENEKRYLQQQLKNFRGKIRQTARHCGIDVKTLYRKMRLHGLNKKDYQ